MGHYLSSFKWLISYIFNRNKFESQTQAFKSSPFFDRLISFFIGPFLSASNLYKKLHNLSERWFRNTFVVQDLYVPIEKLRIFLTQIENNYPIYPLWLCPVKVTKEEELLSPHFVKNCDFVVDVGIYGLANSNITPIEATKFLEDKLKENGGRKMFYTHSYYNQEDLKNIYDLEKFSFIRKKYHAESVFIDFPRKVL
jgi:hypothetical protein